MIADKLTFFHLFGFIPISVISILDILIVAFICHRLLVFIRGTRAGPMLLGLLVIAMAITASNSLTLLKMNALALVLEQLQAILLILLVIIFQPELRRVLVVLGQNPVLRWFYKTESTQVIDEIVAGVVQLADLGYGALIVLVRQVPLGAIVDTGVRVNGEVSADLLTTIFTPRTSLHDQAVVIQDETLLAARCTLPLAENIEDQRLGTRHRAALGLTQETDAVTVVVSEENRTISLAIGGALVRGLTQAELRQRLVELMSPRRESLPVTPAAEEV